MSKILLVEDNPDLALGLRRNLEIDGYDVCHVDSGKDACDQVQTVRPDLVILDMMLPGTMDGFDVISTLRRRSYQGLVLCLTARGEEIDKVRALRSGADDYMTKPFGLMELLARIEALLRRGNSHEPVFTDGRLTVSTDSRLVCLDGRPVELAPREFDLLVYLLRANGAACSRQQILAAVWGHQGVAVTRTVDTHIAELRQKLEDNPARPRRILTVRKVGYRLAVPSDSK